MQRVHAGLFEERESPWPGSEDSLAELTAVNCGAIESDGLLCFGRAARGTVEGRQPAKSNANGEIQRVALIHGRYCLVDLTQDTGLALGRYASTAAAQERRRQPRLIDRQRL